MDLSDTIRIYAAGRCSRTYIGMRDSTLLHADSHFPNHDNNNKHMDNASDEQTQIHSRVHIIALSVQASILRPPLFERLKA